MTEAKRDWVVYEKRLLEGPRHDWRNAACLGLYGYANGRHARDGQARARTIGGVAPAPCSTCRVKEECWAKLREQAREVLPALTDAFEALVATGLTGGALMEAWRREQRRPEDLPGHYPPDPYIALTLLHMQVGMQHESRARAN